MTTATQPTASKHQEPSTKDQARFYQSLPQYHCPQCDGHIDARCVRPRKLANDPLTYRPRRQVDVWCEHCSLGFRAVLELQHAEAWTLISGPTRLHGDNADHLQKFVEGQLNIRRVHAVPSVVNIDPELDPANPAQFASSQEA